MTIWNSTRNPCFSTFDQFFFCVSWIKNSFFTFDYSLWDGGRHTFLRAKTNFNLILHNNKYALKKCVFTEDFKFRIPIECIV